MNPIPRSLAAVLFLLAAAVLGAPAAHGQTVGPNPPAMIIKTAPYTITGSGFYQLGANLTYNGNGSDNDAIITINAPNVTLDFGGHYISGPGTNTATGLYGVYASGQGNLIIQNGTVSHCSIGIYLTGSSGSTPNNLNPTIRNLLVTHCYYEGVELDYAVGASLTGNTVSNIGGSGAAHTIAVYLSSGSDATVSNNTVATVTGSNGNSATGINCSAADSTVSNNTVSAVTTPGGAGVGISFATFAVGNTISTSSYGLFYCTKYKDNVTNGCTTPFSGGTAVGTNQ